VKTADTLLSYLKSKARIMAIPRFAHTSCGIRHQEGVGFVDKKGIPITEWKKNMRPPSIEHESFASDTPLGLQHETDELAESEYIERIARSVMHVSDIMELLLKRAIIAETDVDKEREKVKASQAEVRLKALQLEGMWTRVQEMERVAIGTTTVLKEMQVKLEDMEHETSRQRQRAAENEQELSKVRHDFGMLKSSIENLVTARETIVALEKRVQEMEGISERYPFQQSDCS
jgi:chromosome segregation ATPase